jgi:transcriptional regulator with XRE-family HTH domain
MSVDEFINECFGTLPQWAVALRGLRNREGLTQEALGKLLGIAQTNISKMELGKRPIGKGIAKRLAQLFNTDYHLFL